MKKSINNLKINKMDKVHFGNFDIGMCDCFGRFVRKENRELNSKLQCSNESDELTNETKELEYENSEYEDKNDDDDDDEINESDIEDVVSYESNLEKGILFKSQNSIDIIIYDNFKQWKSTICTICGYTVPNGNSFIEYYDNDNEFYNEFIVHTKRMYTEKPKGGKGYEKPIDK